MLLSLLIFTAFSSFSQAQFPSKPDGITVVTSKLNPDVKISFKQTYICETTPGVKSFSGYVHLPRSALTELEVGFDISTFFWFFGARNNPENAPLVIYLAGGPGESSTYTALNSETGPCYVNPDGNSTTLNPWSFNNDANVLYIDQPVSTGFSYTSLVNATVNITNTVITPLNAYDGQVPKPNATLGVGTFSDQSPWATTNTTITSALALWYFAEHWLTQFPEYTSKNKNIGVWGNSAGGYWAPATAAIWHRKIEESDSGSPLKEWSIDNMGITNGAIDLGQSMPFYPEYAFNNTYKKPLISEDMYLGAKNNYTKEGGCQDLIARCRALGREGDPASKGNNETVNTACQLATSYCMIYVASGVLFQGLNAFDVAQRTDSNDSDLCLFYYPAVVFLNQAWTQNALGAVTNFTYVSNIVTESYTLYLPDRPDVGTGDSFRVTTRDFEYVLQNDIRVALIYGDRDARCPWTAAEALANTANYTGHDDFFNAGYEMINTNNTYEGGVVKQFENFSFSRVFQAGHAVNAYQPETVYRIFSRTISGKDVATGQTDVDDGYVTKGPQSSFYMVEEEMPEVPSTCMVQGSFQDTSPWALLMRNAETGGNGNGTKGEENKNSAAGQNRRIPGFVLASIVLLAVGFSLGF